MDIQNRKELQGWMEARHIAGHNMTAIKGPAPEGMTYDDGEPVIGPVNHAWRDDTTGEEIAIIYANTSVSGPCPPDAAPLQHKLSGG